MADLKPCPFCGNMPQASSWNALCEISCEYEYCPANPSIEGSSLENATILWNTRHMDIGDIGKMSMEAMLKAQVELDRRIHLQTHPRETGAI